MTATKHASWYLVAVSVKFSLMLFLLNRATISYIGDLRWLLTFVTPLMSITVLAAAIFSIVFLRACRQYNTSFFKCLVGYSFLDLGLAILLSRIDKDLNSQISLDTLRSSAIWFGLFVVVNAVVLIASLPPKSMSKPTDRPQRA